MHLVESLCHHQCKVCHRYLPPPLHLHHIHPRILQEILKIIICINTNMGKKIASNRTVWPEFFMSPGQKIREMKKIDGFFFFGYFQSLL